MARRKSGARSQQKAPPTVPARSGVNTLQLAMLVGALAMVGLSFANQRQIGRMGDRLGERLRTVESRFEAASAASTPAPAPAARSGPDPLVQAANPTISALTGVKPVGSKMPDFNRIYEFDLSSAPSRGPAEAPITIVEFSDFQCSFCKRAQPTLARIEEVYGDRLRWVWKHLPLSMHEDAPMAHLASVAAAEQGKFWEFKKKLFLDQGKLKPDHLRQHALEIGLRMQQFEEDLADPAARAAVEADMTEAVAIDLTATPGFFINGRYVRGAQPFEKFAELINEELAKRGQPIPEAARASTAP